MTNLVKWNFWLGIINIAGYFCLASFSMLVEFDNWFQNRHLYSEYRHSLMDNCLLLIWISIVCHLMTAPIIPRVQRQLIYLRYLRSLEKSAPKL